MFFPKPPKRKPRERRTRRHEAYRKARREYLGTHPRCEVCKASESTTVHHTKSRLGPLLTDQRYFLAVCNDCHTKIHAHPEWSFEKGYMLRRNNADE